MAGVRKKQWSDEGFANLILASHATASYDPTAHSPSESVPQFLPDGTSLILVNDHC
jgi:hypothetical protein